MALASFASGAVRGAIRGATRNVVSAAATVNRTRGARANMANSAGRKLGHAAGKGGQKISAAAAHLRSLKAAATKKANGSARAAGDAASKTKLGRATVGKYRASRSSGASRSQSAARGVAAGSKTAARAVTNKITSTKRGAKVAGVVAHSASKVRSTARSARTTARNAGRATQAAGRATRNEASRLGRGFASGVRQGKAQARRGR
jgi:hypothetical protein